jgi:hypothetical protein
MHEDKTLPPAVDLGSTAGLGSVPRWWTCKTHGDALPHDAWGCPECVRELRRQVRQADERVDAAMRRAHAAEAQLEIAARGLKHCAGPLGLCLAPERLSEDDACKRIEAWLTEQAPGYPTYSMCEDGDDAWAFWLAEQDTTSYLHADGRVEWYGTGWPENYKYDGDDGIWSSVVEAQLGGSTTKAKDMI